MKNNNLLLIVASIAIIGIIVMIISSSVNHNNFVTSNNVGFAANLLYPAFETPESGFTINGNTLSATDDAVYKIGYYSINGTPWQPFSLTGNILGSNWLTGTVKYTLPNFGIGEHYVVIYSCSKVNNAWDCHDNKWQLIIINNTINNNPKPSMFCGDGQCNNGETCSNCSKDCGTCPSSALKTFYISTTGSDTTGNGSINTPWKTLAYACSRVTTSGDIIHINSGNYIETNECSLAVGVSIEGEGVSSVIKSHYASSRSSGGISGAAIFLSSPNEGTNGNQHISNLKLDGDSLVGSSDGTVAYIAIGIIKRSNVIIHDCTISHFFTSGIVMFGAGAFEVPSIYATGNQIYNCNITDCTNKEGVWGGGALIEQQGEDGLLVYNNILDQTGKAQGYNGDIIGGQHFKGCKFYNNTFIKPDYDGSNWNFAMEMWDSDGGNEIYNNSFYGDDTAIDCGGDYNVKGSYDYSWYIHNNFFTGTPVKTDNGKYEICVEGPSTNDVWIYNNHFLNLPSPIEICEGWPTPTVERRIYIGYNIFEKCGWSNSATTPNWQNILQFDNAFSNSIISDIYIYNNLILGDQVTHNTGIKIDTVGTLSNFNVKNNIIMHDDNGEFFYIANSGSINGLYVDNNVLYDNANNNNPVFSGNRVNNYEFLNNINADPLFVNAANRNFHLQANSPAIDKGSNVGLTSDYEGNSVPYGKAPDIGAFEHH